MNRRDPTQEPDTSASAPTTARRQRKLPLGTMIAILGVALLAALVWYLTHNAKSGSAAGPGAGTAGAGAPARTASGGPGGPGGPGAGRGGPPTTVGIARAEKSDIPVQLDALGTIASPAAAIVRAQVSGVLQKIHYTEGQLVKQGSLLAEIDPRPFEMALMQASGQRQRDEAQLENARVLLKRYQTLLSQDSIARQDVDTQTALVKQLEGTVAMDRAAEGTAKINLGYTKVTAPISGRVGLRNMDLGNITGPNDTNGLVVITQLEPIDAVFSVPQDQLPEVRQRLAAGETLKVTAWDRGRARQLATGTFLALDNQIDAQTGTARAKARFSNSEKTLFPGQFVNVRLQLATLPDSVLIPVSALRHGSNGDFVFVLNTENKTASMRQVKAGQILEDKVQIVSGLSPGQTVITEGADRLREGAPVNLPGERPGGRGMRGQGGAGGPGGPGSGAGMAQGQQGGPANAQGGGQGGWQGRRRADAAAGQGDAAASPANQSGQRSDAQAQAGTPAQGRP